MHPNCCHSMIKCILSQLFFSCSNSKTTLLSYPSDLFFNIIIRQQDLVLVVSSFKQHTQQYSMLHINYLQITRKTLDWIYAPESSPILIQGRPRNIKTEMNAYRKKNNMTNNEFN